MAVSRFGMVSSVEPNATRAGVQMLEQGGNAVDAAVAVGYALAVTHPSAGNIGGGGFMLVHVGGAPTVAIDFREQAPRALTQRGFGEMIKNRAREPRATGVPGSVAGYNLALSRFGRLRRALVMAPAIALAKDGHELGERQARVLGWSWPLLRRDTASVAQFGRGRAPLEKGQRLIQPQLARTLQRIANQGDAGFYAGSTATAIADYQRAHGGWIDEQDLANYRALVRQPLRTEYGPVQVEVMSPPSAGGVAVVSMLAMLQALDAKRYPVDSVAGLHLFAEVAKRAHAERRFGVVDPDSSTEFDVASLLERWKDPKTWLEPFPISPTAATPAKTLHPLYESAMRELDHTTHFSVMDAEGNAVSCTTTLSGGFGAKYTIGDIGVVMNNSVAAFGTSGLDVPKPGRRMTSSMSPTLLLLGDEVIGVLGSPGGDTIPNTVVQVLRNLVDGHLTLDAAIDAPRIHHGFVPDAIRYESKRPPSKTQLEGLRKLGHAFTDARLTIGDANDIIQIDGNLYGYADMREGGLALGPSSKPPVAPFDNADDETPRGTTPP